MEDDALEGGGGRIVNGIGRTWRPHRHGINRLCVAVGEATLADIRQLRSNLHAVLDCAVRSEEPDEITPLVQLEIDVQRPWVGAIEFGRIVGPDEKKLLRSKECPGRESPLVWLGWAIA